MVIKIRYGIVGMILLLLFISATLFVSFNNHPDEINVAAAEQPAIVPIIMYHEVKTYHLGKDVISPYEFESDLAYLAKHHYTTINITDLVGYVYYDQELPENPVILTFDDGYLSTYKYVFPLIKKYHMKIVFSIIGKNTDDFTRIPDNNIDYSHVTWDQLNEMIATGYVEVQNHSYNLHKISYTRYGCTQKFNESFIEYEGVLRKDVGSLQEKILYMTGELPNTFTYPYGKSSKNTDLILRKLGFKATLSCKYGINLITTDPNKLFGLKRICRSHGKSIGKLIEGGMKTIKYIRE